MSQTAYNGSASEAQVTEYLFEDPVAASRVTLTKYPDGNTSTDTDRDNIQIAYNLDGSVATRTDQRGVKMSYAYNERRQLDYMGAMIPAGSGVDNAVQSIGYRYDELARRTQVTSYATNVATGTVVNEVEYTYNDLGQLVAYYQDHDGAVDTSESPKVAYNYDPLVDVSGVYDNGARVTSMTYPSGRVVEYGYGAEADSVYERMSRVHTMSEGVSEGVSRLLLTVHVSGQGRLARQQFDKISEAPGTPEDVVLDLWQTAPETTTRYDRFGRIGQMKYTQGAASVVDLAYGYDAGSNRVYREDMAAAASGGGQDLDEFYGHDGLSRMNNFQVGVLNANKTAIASEDLAFKQNWGLDQLGNWESFNEDIDGDGNDDLVQDRTANTANEITDIGIAPDGTGADWINPVYDAAGNMTQIPQADTPADGFTATYDAWNRLVKLEDTGGVVATYAYNGVNHRVQKTVGGFGGDTFDTYYNTGWQALEVRKNDAPNPYEQFVYDGSYIDAPFMRYVDADTDGILDEDTDGEQYYLRDASFNVVALLDAAGAALERYRYNAVRQTDRDEQHVR